MDKERVLGKIDELESYLKELNQIMPMSFREYKNIEKKRSCERLLHISIECVLDICSIIVSELRLGLPTIEDDLFEKLKDEKVISEDMATKLKSMKSFRNILVLILQVLFP
ncbi:MAG: DUF86 domain-containing protein, partial [Methanosarcinales archaeon]